MIDHVRVDIDSKVRSSCTWIYTGLRDSYEVGHLLLTDRQAKYIYWYKLGNQALTDNSTLPEKSEPTQMKIFKPS